jgi:hypothetical protein
MATFSYKKDITGEIVTIKGDYGISGDGYCKLIDDDNGILGRMHSETGPAVEWNSGRKEWYLDGVEYTKIQWLNKLGK